MKSIFNLLVWVTLASAAVSCDSNDRYPKFLLFPKEGGEMIVAPSENFSTDIYVPDKGEEPEGDLNLIFENEWAKAVRTTRGILVTVQPNDTGKRRQCMIDDSAPPVSTVTIEIYQDK